MSTLGVTAREEDVRVSGRDGPAVAIIGVGRLGEAVLAGLREAGMPGSALAGAAMPLRRAQALSARYGAAIGTDSAAAAANAELVLLVVPPDIVTAAAASIAGVLAADAVVVSLAAGVGTSEIQRHLPAGTPVIRAMTNSAIKVRQAMTALSPGTAVTPAQLARVRWLFEQVGVTVEVPESAQPVMTAVAGSGPAFVYHQAAAMISAAIAEGLDASIAATTVIQAVYGAAAMLKQTPASPETLADQISAPGGATCSALDELDRGHLAEIIGKAVSAAVRRCQELA